MLTNQFRGLCLTPLAAFLFSVHYLPAKEIPLFEDVTFDDFYIDFSEETDAEEVFEFGEDSSLTITAKEDVIGYMQTLDPYENYTLSLEYRWDGEPGKSGILIHSGDDLYASIWPYSIEIQIEEKNVGDLWLRGLKLEVEKESQIPDKHSERNRRKKLEDAEKRRKESWNELKIVAEKDTLEVHLNDELVNKATELSETSGYITFQAEEGTLELRNVVLREIEINEEEEN